MSLILKGIVRVSFTVLMGVRGWCQSTPPQPIQPGPLQGGARGSVRVVLSEVEKLKLENLHLKKQVLELQVKLAQQALTLEIQDFTREVAATHGVKTGVTVNLDRGEVLETTENKESKSEKKVVH